MDVLMTRSLRRFRRRRDNLSKILHRIWEISEVSKEQWLFNFITPLIFQNLTSHERSKCLRHLFISGYCSNLLSNYIVLNQHLKALSHWPKQTFPLILLVSKLKIIISEWFCSSLLYFSSFIVLTVVTVSHRDFRYITYSASVEMKVTLRVLILIWHAI